MTDNLGLPEGATISYAPKNGTAFEANENGWSYVVTASTTDTFSNVGECEFSVTLYKFGKWIITGLIFSVRLFHQLSY